MLVAVQHVPQGDPFCPLNRIQLLPCEAPKFVPVTVIVAPTGPEPGDTLVIAGVAITVKLVPLLLAPLAFTTMLPVVAPAGTGTLMLVALHVCGVPTVPLKVTLPLPCVAPKFVPVIVTSVPTVPDEGERLVMAGLGTTEKAWPVLATPNTVTTTLPDVAPVGTAAVMLVALQFVAVAVVPLNFSVLVPWLAPKFVPAIVTTAPTAPLDGESIVMLGSGVTVKAAPLLSTPTRTTTLPLVAPTGTFVTMLVELHVVMVATVPLNLTVLVPFVAPKFDPAIVTDAPTAPELGVNVVMLGAATTVNAFPALATPDTVTTTLPVVAPAGTVAAMLVALQLVAVAVVPLNLTVLVPWVEPNPVPVIVMDAPIAPDVGDSVVMDGAACADPESVSKKTTERQTAVACTRN